MKIGSPLRLAAAACFTLVAACAGIGPAAAKLSAPRHRHHHHTPTLSPQDIKFDKFVADFRDVALAAGIAPATYDAAMSGLHRNAHVEALAESQPEFVKPIWSYLDSAASPRRVSDGQAHLAAQLASLTAIEAKYGVPKEILVSIWGNETDYGNEVGGFNLFEALATLAYDGTRMDFGRSELLAALKVLQQEKLDPHAMTASWAGAFGQLQMLPSTFLKSAVDGDGDGRRDLWHSTADALASAAAEVSNDGWLRGHVWGYEVRLPETFAYENANGETLKTIAEWSALGVRAADGTALPPNVESGAIHIPAGRRGPAFMTFANFKAILKYNNAVSYALAVCILADMIAGRPGVIAPWPRDEQPLSHDERIAFQNTLVKLGYPLAKIDGILGHDTRAQLRLYQKSHGLPSDGFPTMSLLVTMLVEAKQKRL